MVELAPDRRGGLSDFFDRGEAVEASHQRVLERAGNGERWQWPCELVMVAGVLEQPEFQHRLGQLLDEQRNAVGPGDDLVQDLFGQGLAGRRAARQWPRHGGG